MNLWTHQLQALENLKKVKSYALHMDPGTGKTAVAVKWIESLTHTQDHKVLIFTPPVVCAQWKQEFETFANGLHKRVAIATGSSKKKIEALKSGASIIVTNYEGVRSKDVLKALHEFSPTTLICDECFHPETLVLTKRGEIKIKDVVVGDFVFNCLGWKKVIKTFSKKVDASYEITFNGRKITVSKNHLFFTKHGWIPTKDLKKGDYFVSTNQAMSILQQGIYKDCLSFDRETLLYLFSQLRNEIKSEDGGISGLYSESKSNVFKENEGESKQYFEKNETQASYSRWKWARANGSRTDFIGETWERLCLQFFNWYKKRIWLSNLLQNRCSLSKIKAWYRSGWIQSFRNISKKTRQEERNEIEFIRLEDIKILESTSDERNPRGLFYDLEVEGHPSFTINGILVHNSHRVKSPSAMQSKEIAKLSRLCLYRLNMTGTPMTNSELDLFQQFYILDGGATFGNNFYSFRGKYFEDKNASRRGAHNYFPDWQVRKGSTEAIKAILSKRSFVVRKSECLDLPDMIYKEVEVELSSEQLKAYKEMKEDFLTTLKDAQGNAQTAVGRLAITKGLRLQQIVSGFVTPETSEEISFKDNPRLDALSDLLEDLPSPVIVWASFRRNYKDIASVCEKLKLSFGFLTGGQSQKDRDQTLEDFRAGKLNVLIANQGAGGVGVNLIEAPNAIYYSRDFSLEKDIQSEARNYRGGSEIHEKVTRYDLVAKGTIDMDVLKALRGKRDVLEYLLQGVK